MLGTHGLFVVTGTRFGLYSTNSNVSVLFWLDTIVLWFYSDPLISLMSQPICIHQSKVWVPDHTWNFCHKLISSHCCGHYFIDEYFICVAKAANHPFTHHFLINLSLFPSHTLQKCMRFNPDATVWVAKQRILCTLNQSLKDVLNYGLFQPASNGRDGKFLDEERLLREYPQPISKGVPCLEVKPIRVKLKCAGMELELMKM